MKTCAMYGFVSALAGAFLVLIQYFLGLHSDISKLATANAIGGLGGLAIAVTCTVLGVKAARAEVPSTEEFGYARALGAGLLISLFASLISAVFLYCYHAFINPELSGIMLQDSFNKLEARGLSGDRLDRMESFNRMLFTPVWLAVVAAIIGFVVGAVISLIVAAVLKRPAPPEVRS